MHKSAAAALEKLHCAMPAAWAFMADQKYGDLPTVLSSWINATMEKWINHVEQAELAKNSDSIVDVPSIKDRMQHQTCVIAF